MKILSATQIREADQYTIKHEPIKSIDLMERAAGKCFDWIYQRAPKLFPSHITEEKDWKFCVVSGVGNNGGDGLAIARMLDRNGYNVNVVIVHASDKPSDDFSKNFDKLGKLKSSTEQLKGKTTSWKPDPDSVLIDCIFGTGLSRKVEGIAADVIRAINAAGCPVVSIDLPSGMFCTDNGENDLTAIVKSTYLLSFQVPKLAFYLSENAPFIGELYLLDIGLHPQFLDAVKTDFHLVEHNYAKSIRRDRQTFSHKGDYGHVGVIAGSRGKYGAAALTCKAAMRAGAGKVSLHSGKLAEQIVLNYSPEVMVLAQADSDYPAMPTDISQYDALVVGPGMGLGDEAAKLLEQILKKSKAPLILDADALQILADHKALCDALPENTILTPHPGEFKKLVGERATHFERMELQRVFSKKHKVIVLLKGAHSSLSLPNGEIIINSSGNAGMATAGAGDVLSGLIGALLGAGYPPSEAACLAMFVHGCAGDLALTDQSVESLIASDIIDKLGAAFKSLDCV